MAIDAEQVDPQQDDVLNGKRRFAFDGGSGDPCGRRHRENHKAKAGHLAACIDGNKKGRCNTGERGKPVQKVSHRDVELCFEAVKRH